MGGLRKKEIKHVFIVKIKKKMPYELRNLV